MAFDSQDFRSTKVKVFKEAAGEALSSVHMIARIRENSILMGLLAGSVESVYLRGASLARKYDDIIAEEARKEKEASDIISWISLLDQMKDYRDRLGDEIDGLEEAWKGKYGDNPIIGFAEVNLSDEALEEFRKLKTDEERRSFLVSEIFDENGELKPEYKNLDPEDVRILKKWYEYDSIDARIGKIDARYEEEGLSKDVKSDIAATVNEISDESVRAALKASISPEIAAEIEQAKTNEAGQNAAVVTSLDY